MSWFDRFNKALKKEADFAKRDLEACKLDKESLFQRIQTLDAENGALGLKVAEKEKIISLLDLKLEASRTKPEEAQVLGRISIEEASALLTPLTPNTYLSDNTYNLTSAEEARKFCEQTRISANTWREEDYDCDEFSFALLGYWNESLKNFAFGTMWSATHAYNFMIDHNRKLWIVEPQNNTFYTLEEAKRIKTPDGLSYWPMRMIIL